MSAPSITETQLANKRGAARGGWDGGCWSGCRLRRVPGHLGGAGERSKHRRSLPLSTPTICLHQRDQVWPMGRWQRDVPCPACAGSLQVPLQGGGDGPAELRGESPAVAGVCLPAPGTAGSRRAQGSPCSVGEGMSSKATALAARPRACLGSPG